MKKKEDTIIAERKYAVLLEYSRRVVVIAESEHEAIAEAEQSCTMQHLNLDAATVTLAKDGEAPWNR